MWFQKTEHSLDGVSIKSSVHPYLELYICRYSISTWIHVCVCRSSLAYILTWSCTRCQGYVVHDMRGC